jgi:hypothetical protein
MHRPLLVLLGIGVWTSDVPDAIWSKHLLRIRPPAEADASIGSQVSMHTSYFSSAIIPVCNDLTTGAVRFTSKRGTWMAVSLKRFVEIAFHSPIRDARVVEHLAKPTNRNKLNRRWIAHV